MKADLSLLPRRLAGLITRNTAPERGRVLLIANLFIGAAAGCAALVIGSVALFERLGTGEAAAPGPGMNLELPDGGAVSPGETVRVQVIAGPAPTTASAPGCTDVEAAGPDGFCDLRGYRSKIEIPPGLSWVPGVPPCEPELPPAPPGTSLCTSDPAGNALHAVTSPAVAVLISHGAVLVEIDLLCLAPGKYSLSLPTLLSDPNGTVYFDFNGSIIPVKSESAAAIACSEGAGNVDPGGGSVDTGTGDLIEARLEVAIAALSGPTMITIDPQPASTAPELEPTFNDEDGAALIPDPANMPVLLAEVFDFGPDGLEMNNLASKLTFTYQDAAITQGHEDALGVLHYDEFDGRWQQMPVLSRDIVNNTISVNVDSFSIYGVYEPVTQDTDSDGCRDVDELQTLVGTQVAGGRRNPLFYWDFYDIPTGQFPDLAKDRAVSGVDFFSLLARFGTSGNPGENPIQTPLTPPGQYHPIFDRTGAQIPPAAGIWNTRVPDGAVAGTDFFALLGSFGHACVTA